MIGCKLKVDDDVMRMIILVIDFKKCRNLCYHMKNDLYIKVYKNIYVC